jgi:O-antigen ligase
MIILRVGICMLAAFAVFAHGAVEPWSESVLELGAAALLAWWGILFAAGVAPAIRWNWLFVPLAGFWACGAVQFLAGLTASPFLTRIEWLKLSALIVLFFLAIQAFAAMEHWRSLIWFLMILGFVVSVQGILQHFTFNGKLYWFRELRYGGIPFGPYVNRNHFAGLIELIVPTGLAILLLRADKRDHMPMVLILTLLPLGALFLSASRGGMIGVALEGGLVMTLVFLRRHGRHQLAAVAVVLLLAGGLVAWLGVGGALDRFSSLRQLEVSENRRAEMVRDSWRIFVDHPIDGIGLGALQEVFPRYETLYDGNVVQHTHNDYVEALAETGIVGGLLGVAFLLLLLWESWARLVRAADSTDLAYHIGAVAACAGLLVHSLVDFNLHIPSNALIFLLQCALATSLLPSRWPISVVTDSPRPYRRRVAVAEDSI